MFSKNNIQKKIVVIGGGISGISAAIQAIENNFDVTIIEASNSFGGRINSSIVKVTGDSIDNGQHIMVGAYNVFFEILKKLNSFNKLYIQDKFQVNYIDGSKKFKIESKFFKDQIGFLLGLLSFKEFTFLEKISIIKLVLKIKQDKFKTNNNPFLDVLKKYKQSEKVIKIFWEPLCVATLNTPIDSASTSIIANVLKQSFFNSGFNSKIIIPKVGLGELISEFEEYFIQKGGKILKNHSLKEVKYNGKMIEKLILTKNEEIVGDYYISALSYNRYNSFFNQKIDLKSSAIISAYLWYDIDFIDEDFVCVLNKNIQWIFNKRKFDFEEGKNGYPGFYSITISDANKLLEKSNSEILDILTEEINQLYPIKKELLHSKIIKEKNATFLADTKSIETKSYFENPISNLFITGDWGDLELPSTIETAARSGRNAVEKIINS